jgi:hypothetical protein
MANSDRGGNWVLDADGRLWSIDQGSAFPVGGYEVVSGHNDFANFLVDADGIAPANPLTASDMAAVTTRVTALREHFTRLGRQDWYEDVAGRLARLSAAAKGRRSFASAPLPRPLPVEVPPPISPVGPGSGGPTLVPVRATQKQATTVPEVQAIRAGAVMIYRQHNLLVPPNACGPIRP